MSPMQQITPTGTIDGSNTSFTLDNTYAVDQVHLFLNGLLLRQGVDYTVSGTSLSYTAAPLVGDWHVASVPILLNIRPGVFLESFDCNDVGTLTARGWTWNTSQGFVAGRTGSAFRIKGSSNFLNSQIFSGASTAACGVAFRTTSLDASTPIVLRRGSTPQIYLQGDGFGKISMVRGDGTVLGTTAPILTMNAWTYLELEVVCASSGGYAELRVNGITLLTFSGNTKNASDNIVDNYLFSGLSSTASYDLDDFYLNWGGDVAFYGPVQIALIEPSGDGFYSQFSPFPSTSHYLNVDEMPQDGDTSYNEGGAASSDTYRFSNSSLSGAIRVVQQSMEARANGSGVVQNVPLFRFSSTDYLDNLSRASLTGTYQYFNSVRTINPNTGVPFTVADIANGEWGVQAWSAVAMLEGVYISESVNLAIV